MRINPNTGEIVSDDNDFCPNCDGYLDDDSYPYCDRCGEYVGVVSRGYSNYYQNPQNFNSNNNDSGDNPLFTKRDKACCGTMCFIIFLLWFIGMLTR